MTATKWREYVVGWAVWWKVRLRVRSGMACQEDVHYKAEAVSRGHE